MRGPQQGFASKIRESALLSPWLRASSPSGLASAQGTTPNDISSLPSDAQQGSLVAQGGLHALVSDRAIVRGIFDEIPRRGALSLNQRRSLSSARSSDGPVNADRENR